MNFFLVTCISGNKSIIFFYLSNLSHAYRIFERNVLPEMNIFSKITFESLLIGFCKNQYEQNILLGIIEKQKQALDEEKKIFKILDTFDTI